MLVECREIEEKEEVIVRNRLKITRENGGKGGKQTMDVVGKVRVSLLPCPLYFWVGGRRRRENWPVRQGLNLWRESANNRKAPKYL